AAFRASRRRAAYSRNPDFRTMMGIIATSTAVSRHLLSHALPGPARRVRRLQPERDREFESTSLQQGVHANPQTLLAQVPRPSGWPPPSRRREKATLLPGGTGGSNPASSTGESISA